MTIRTTTSLPFFTVTRGDDRTWVIISKPSLAFKILTEQAARKTSGLR